MSGGLPAFRCAGLRRRICPDSWGKCMERKYVKMQEIDPVEAALLRRPCVPVRIWRFYRDGFRSMTWGRTLWVIILVKLFVMFAILKVFFFPDFLKGKSDSERGDFVGTELVSRKAEPFRDFGR